MPHKEYNNVSPDTHTTSLLRIVIIMSEVPPDDHDATESTISAQLADLQVSIDFMNDIRLPADADEQDQIARKVLKVRQAAAAFIIFPEPGQSLRIVFSGEDNTLSTTREVNVSKGMPLQEAFAVIVRSTTISLIAYRESYRGEQKKRTISSESKKNTKSTVTDVAVPSPGSVKPTAIDNRPDGLFVDIGGAFDIFAGNKDLAPGMAVGAGWRLTRQWQIQMGTVLFLSSSVRLRDTTLTLKRIPMYLGPVYMKKVGHFMAGGGGAMRFDIVREQLSTTNPDAELKAAGVELHFSIYFYLRAGWWLNRFLYFHADLGVAFQLSRNGYGVTIPTGDQVLIDPLPVQPMTLIGLQLHFL